MPCSRAGPWQWRPRRFRSAFSSGTSPFVECSARIAKPAREGERHPLAVSLPAWEHNPDMPSAAPPLSLSASFTWCRWLARRTARNFYYAFRVLPRSQARAMDALYAFMRVTDDLADDDGPTSARRTALIQWRADLDAALTGEPSHPLHPALAAIVERYAIPPRYLHAVIDGVESDLQPVRFETFAELRRYCYRVASAVGLSCIHVWGFRDGHAEEYAEAAG